MSLGYLITKTFGANEVSGKVIAGLCPNSDVVLSHTTLGIEIVLSPEQYLSGDYPPPQTTACHNHADHSCRKKYYVVPGIFQAYPLFEVHTDFVTFCNINRLDMQIASRLKDTLILEPIASHVLVFITDDAMVVEDFSGRVVLALSRKDGHHVMVNSVGHYHDYQPSVLKLA